jgi:outer membrane protein OmpA-like peptidoglycan-associated protein
MNYKKIQVYILTAALLGVSPGVFAQSGLKKSSELRKANNLYNNQQYALAIEKYMATDANNNADLKTSQQIADSYRQLQRTKEAESWYAKVVAMPERDPMNLYHYAEMLRSNGKYEEAKIQYEQWATEQPDMATRAQSLKASADFAIEAANKPAIATVKEIQKLNASGYSDLSPKPFKGGIIFSSDRGAGSESEIYGMTGRPFLQLYTAQNKGKGEWSNPVLLQDLSVAGTHNATASAPESGKVVYFTRSRGSVGSGVNSDPTSWTKPLVNNNLEIYSAETVDGKLANITPFIHNKVKEYSVGHPALSADGKTMYFVSDMPGGLGETDIYYTTLQGDGSWGQPVNAGPVVNTAGRETYPYVAEDGTLYFSSNGHPGMGGLDIFTAEGTLGAWSEVKNAGQPINSSKNDFGIMFMEAGKTGMFSSNRNTTDGTDDIFEFDILPRQVIVALKTVDNEDAAVSDVKLNLQQKGKDSPVSATTDKTGTHYITGRVGEEYDVSGTKDGYLKQSINIIIPETAGDTLSIAMNLSSIELANKIKIYYDTNKWNIRPDAAKELDKLVALLKENPEISIEIGAHADSRHTTAYNQKLSEKRAKSVVDYLVTKAIDRSRLQSKGYGETKLVNRCKNGVKCTDAEHQVNRRTEFKVLKK